MNNGAHNIIRNDGGILRNNKKIASFPVDDCPIGLKQKHENKYYTRW